MARAETDDGPVTQITVVDTEKGETERVLELMCRRAEFMAKQPGFVSISLHRSKDGNRLVNFIEWENLTSLHDAHAQPEFRKGWSELGQATDEIDPELYEPVLERSRH